MARPYIGGELRLKARSKLEMNRVHLGCNLMKRNLTSISIVSATKLTRYERGHDLSAREQRPPYCKVGKQTSGPTRQVGYFK
jgi:hypothetical protein